MPDELQTEVTLSVFQLPDRRQLEKILNGVASERATSREIRLAKRRRSFIPVAGGAASGLTANESQLAFRSAAVRGNGLTPAAAKVVAESKTQVIRKSGILEYYHQSESFADVGGLQNLLAWFQGRWPAFASTARYAGLPLPKGVLLVGVPGCGKSLSARALAGAWQVPLVRLNVGRIFGSIFALRKTISAWRFRRPKRSAPGIFWIDEVEKGFSGVQGQGGGGVAARVFGAFLNWLQDKRSPVFVVATANDLSGIPSTFTTNSHVAIVGNEWKSLSPDVKALEDRGHAVFFDPSAIEVHRNAASWFWNQEIFDFIRDVLHLITTPSLRLYVRAAELYSAQLDWKSIVLGQCLTGTALEVAKLKANSAFSSEEERVREFVRCGFGCRATYFDHAARIACPVDDLPQIKLTNQISPAQREAEKEARAASILEILRRRQMGFGKN